MKDDRNATDPRSLIDRNADWHLNNWAAWTEQYRIKSGFNRASTVICARTSSTFDDMCHAEDMKNASVCEAVIDSLDPIYKAAIYNVYLRSIFRFRGDPLQVFVEAVERFWVLAQRRGLN